MHASVASDMACQENTSGNCSMVIGSLQKACQTTVSMSVLTGHGEISSEYKALLIINGAKS